jgi:hypothetical protein
MCIDAGHGSGAEQRAARTRVTPRNWLLAFWKPLLCCRSDCTSWAFVTCATCRAEPAHSDHASSLPINLGPGSVSCSDRQVPDLPGRAD